MKCCNVEYECRNGAPDVRFVSDSAEGWINFGLLPLWCDTKIEKEYLSIYPST